MPSRRHAVSGPHADRLFGWELRAERHAVSERHRPVSRRQTYRMHRWECAINALECGASQECPDEAPLKCPDGSCALTFGECLTTRFSGDVTGDLNNDNTTDSGDALELFEAIVTGEELSLDELSTIDFDGDGLASETDVMCILFVDVRLPLPVACFSNDPV